MPKPLIVCSTLLLATAACQADGADWLPSVGTGNCSVTDLDFSDTRHGFAAGAFNCGLVTADGGLSWQPVQVMPQQSQSLLFAHAASADSLYAARQSLYHSADRGETWREVGPMLNSGSVFDIHFASTSRWVAIKGGQIQLTTDAGATWLLVYEGEFRENVDELHFPGAGRAFATGGVFREFGEFGTVLRSDDQGTTWALQDFDHGMITAGHFISDSHGIVATLNQGLFETRDGAQTWTRIGDTPGGPGLNDLISRGDHWVASSISGCLYESFDSAQTWQLAVCDPSGRAFAALSHRDGRIVAAGNDGLVMYENRVFRSGFETD